MDSAPGITNTFIHKGIISEIKGRSIIVSLEEDVHCESCRAKSVCGASQSSSKEIEITDPEGSFRLNEPVEVHLRKDLGHKALFWAYIFPFILLLLTLLTTSMFYAEWLAGLLSILVLIPYYLLLYAGKDYFRKTFKISILRI
ncbi:MAG: SoxR reducing system RseC family protein [Robiginitalea sp.]